MSNILKLLEYLLVISPSTASYERLIKTKYRTGLKLESLQSQLMMMTEGPELEHFDVNRAIAHWLADGPGTWHITGHKLPSS